MKLDDKRDQHAPHSPTIRTALAMAALAFGCSIGANAWAADTQAPASVHVSMIGRALRSSDLDRSIKFYEQGLGMQTLRKIKMGSATEVILGFGSDPGQPMILLLKNDAPGESPAIEHGNGFARIVLRVDDADALSARLSAAGYQPDEMHSDPVHHRKVFWATDPDGYRYEIAQTPSQK